jgi:hypothetical protein
VHVLRARDEGDHAALKAMSLKAARTRSLNRQKAKDELAKANELKEMFARRKAEKEFNLQPWVVRHDDLLPVD